MHIVKKYVELYGGQIFVASAVGMGTTVKVYIPLKEESNEENSYY